MQIALTHLIFHWHNFLPEGNVLRKEVQYFTEMLIIIIISKLIRRKYLYKYIQMRQQQRGKERKAIYPQCHGCLSGRLKTPARERNTEVSCYMKVGNLRRYFIHVQERLLSMKKKSVKWNWYIYRKQERD